MSTNKTRERMSIILSALAALFLYSMAAAPGWAEEMPGAEEGTPSVGFLGILEFEAKINLGVDHTDGGTRPVLRFLSEPRIAAVDPEGPGREKLEVGDIIVAINGHLITTQRAGDLFVYPPVGEPIDLTIRRDGVEKKVAVVPTRLSEDDSRTPLYRLIHRVKERVRLRMPREERDDKRGSDRDPRPDRKDDRIRHRRGRSDRPLPAWSGLPHPWMGFGLECSIDGNWTSDDLRFTKPPKVFRVEPESKAKEAGLRRRDLITHIDGIPIDSFEGTERFTKIAPGQRIEWTVVRDGTPLTIDMEAQPIPRWAARLSEEPETSVMRDPLMEALRYSGLLGDTAIEVRGSVPVNVTVDEGSGQVIIQTGDTIVRLKKTD